MEKQKKFKKQELKHGDFEGMEQGAKVVKGGLGLAAVIGVVVKNKENLKALGKSAVKLAKQVIKL